MSMQTPLGKVRGLGSAKEGAHHWWHQRLTALALLPLTAWFVISMITLMPADYAAAQDWLGSPIVAGLMLLLIFALFYHLKLGLQVVVEDYVHTPWLKTSTLIVLMFASILLGLASVLSVLLVAFGV
jgi:succinate dehydrogenase / fumarate reductase membrane anchor subunit